MFQISELFVRYQVFQITPNKSLKNTVNVRNISILKLAVARYNIYYTRDSILKRKKFTERNVLVI